MSPLDLLRDRALAAVANAPRTKRPTWAPPLVLTEDLAEVVRTLGLLAEDAPPVARLWARFTEWHDVVGYDLRPGTVRGKKWDMICGAQRCPDGSWVFGPKWSNPPPDRPDTPERAARRKLRNIAVALGGELIVAFAGDPEARMIAGARLARICCNCGRKLTDDLSLERGIGPECWSGGARAA